MSDDYYEEFLDADDVDAAVPINFPSWVSSKNSSQKAYEVIVDLKKVKRKFIRKHGLKSEYSTKSSYQIQKSEVARLVGSKPQPLFNSCSYSESLTEYLKGVNEELAKAKEKRIKNKGGGLWQENKDALVKELQESKNNNEQLLVKTVDKVFEKTIDSLPLDIKRKLGF